MIDLLLAEDHATEALSRPLRCDADPDGTLTCVLLVGTSTGSTTSGGSRALCTTLGTSLPDVALFAFKAATGKFSRAHRVTLQSSGAAWSTFVTM